MLIRDISAQLRWEKLPLGLCSLDTDLRYIEINEWLAALNGFSMKHHIGRTIQEVLPDIAEPVVAVFRNAIETGEPVINGIVEGETPSQPGVRRTFRHNYTAIRSTDGTVVGISCVVEDITEIAKAEEALKLVHRDLERRVIDRTAKLDAALQTADLANRAKTQFLANTSHELRTPMNAIIGFTELLMAGVPVTPSATQMSYFKDIHGSALHLLDVINDILDLSKIESNVVELSETDFEIGETIKASLRILAERAVQGGLSVSTDVSSDLPRLRADERIVKQIMINLLANAVKFTPAGGTITVTAALVEDGGMEIRVSDTGIGMAKADIATAVAAFGQIDGDLNRRFEGAGLGFGQGAPRGAFGKFADHQRPRPGHDGHRQIPRRTRDLKRLAGVVEMASARLAGSHSAMLKLTQACLTRPAPSAILAR